MKNRITVIGIIVLMVVGLFALSQSGPPAQVARLQVCESIDGNSPLEPAPSLYLVTCLPKDWKTDPDSQRLVRDMSSENFVRLGKIATTQTFIDGDAGFEHRFQSGNNSGPVSKLPAVLVMSNGEQVFRKSGPEVKYAAADLQKILDRFPCKPKPAPVEPDDKPSPDDRPTVPDSPDTDLTPPAIITEDTDMTLLALSAIAGGFVGWAFMFNRKVSKK